MHYTLAQMLRERPSRPLPIALAHCLVNTSLRRQTRVAVLNRIYRRLKPAQQIRCRLEIIEARAAKRGERIAQVC